MVSYRANHNYIYLPTIPLCIKVAADRDYSCLTYLHKLENAQQHLDNFAWVSLSVLPLLDASVDMRVREAD